MGHCGTGTESLVGQSWWLTSNKVSVDLTVSDGFSGLLLDAMYANVRNISAYNRQAVPNLDSSLNTDCLTLKVIELSLLSTYCTRLKRQEVDAFPLPLAALEPRNRSGHEYLNII